MSITIAVESKVVVRWLSRRYRSIGHMDSLHVKLIEVVEVQSVKSDF